MDVCEPPCGCWDLNSGPPEKQSVLLTAEPSLQPLFPFLNTYILSSSLQTPSMTLTLFLNSINNPIKTLISKHLKVTHRVFKNRVMIKLVSMWKHGNTILLLVRLKIGAVSVEIGVEAAQKLYIPL
jgi:hypothetical protein